MKDKFATIIRAVNYRYVKASAANTKLFTKLCKDMDSIYEILLFHTSVRWLLRINMSAYMYEYEIKDELRLFFEANRKQNLSLSIESKDADLADIFEALNVSNSIL